MIKKLLKIIINLVLLASDWEINFVFHSFVSSLQDPVGAVCSQEIEWIICEGNWMRIDKILQMSKELYNKQQNPQPNLIPRA